MKSTFLAFAALAVAASADTFTWSVNNGNFTTHVVNMATENNKWDAGAVATVTMFGETHKVIEAGSVKWELYELYQQHKVQTGTADYFNRGPADPAALSLQNPTSSHTSFKLTVQFVIPAPTVTGNFTLVMSGQDQDHVPLDFSLSINFLGRNYTTGRAVEVEKAVEAVSALQNVRNTPYTWHAENGNFTVDALGLYSTTGDLTPGTSVTTILRGRIATLILTAGTVKYQIWEEYVTQFVDSGNAPYFQCTNKGCVVTAPVATLILTA